MKVKYLICNSAPSIHMYIFEYYSTWNTTYQFGKSNVQIPSGKELGPKHARNRIPGLSIIHLVIYNSKSGVYCVP